MQQLKERNHIEKIEEVIKIRDYTNIFKIVCEDKETADHILDKGFVMFDMSVANHQIEREDFINLKMCFICFKVEDHHTNECPTPTRIACSRCSEEGHKYKDCKSSYEKCLNCAGEHQTMAMACPRKKEAMKKIRDERKEIRNIPTQYSRVTENRSYASMMQNKTPYTEQRTPNSSNDGTKMMMICIHAHTLNLGTPGTYNEELEKALIANNYPTIKTRNVTEAESARVILALQNLENIVEKEAEKEKETHNRTYTIEKETENEKENEKRPNMENKNEKRPYMETTVIYEEKEEDFITIKKLPTKTPTPQALLGKRIDFPNDRRYDPPMDIPGNRKRTHESPPTSPPMNKSNMTEKDISNFTKLSRDPIYSNSKKTRENDNYGNF